MDHDEQPEVDEGRGERSPEVGHPRGPGHENGRPFWHYESLNYDEIEPKLAVDRVAFIALDRGSSGVFLLEKATGLVWSIRGYGKKNRVVKHIDDLTAEYREATEQNLLKMKSIH